MKNSPPKRQPAAGLTAKECRLLAEWKSSGRITQQEIADRMGSTQQSISRRLAKAKAKAGIPTGRSPRRKVKPVSLSQCVV